MPASIPTQPVMMFRNRTRKMSFGNLCARNGRKIGRKKIRLILRPFYYILYSEVTDMRETRNLEFKENITNTFLKTVSAYANCGTGEILFGISDDGKVLGIPNPRQACMDIENKINDSIDPVPDYTLSINEKTSVISLKVTEGLHKPYLYKAKAYRRNDSATIPADRLELRRLILDGQDKTFEELAADSQNLSFKFLEERLISLIKIEHVNMDTMKTLELYSNESGYNKAAELLADSNDFPGVDIARFGESINIILDRETHEHMSILKLYDKSLAMYKKYYQYEEIKGSTRLFAALVPEEAFREAVANALVHRVWDVSAQINISMYPDRIEITSPGGLPKGMNEEEYLRGGISILRNRIIGSIFFRLHLIERFGTGIKRIQEEYKDSSVKPVFAVSENAIRITLPVKAGKKNLSQDENRVYLLLKGREMPSSAVAEAAGFGKSKAVEILKGLVQKGFVSVSGKGRGTRYTV